MDHLDESTHHLLASSKVCDNAIAQRTDSTDVVMSLLVHHLRLFAHGNHLVGAAVEGYNRRFVHYNLIITDNDGIGGTQVHCDFLNK